jgi:hypothetical protein
MKEKIRKKYFISKKLYRMLRYYEKAESLKKDFLAWLNPKSINNTFLFFI